MGAPKGRAKPAGSGRVKGQVNKNTAEIKGMIETALKNVGGVEYLQRQAEENPVAFMQLIGKILPKDHNVDGSVTVILNTNVPR